MSTKKLFVESMEAKIVGSPHMISPSFNLSEHPFYSAFMFVQSKRADA